MYRKLLLPLFILVAAAAYAAQPHHPLKWIIEVKKGGARTAHRIAKKYGLKYGGPIGHVGGMYLLTERPDRRRHRRSSVGAPEEKEIMSSVSRLLIRDPDLLAAEPQVELKRVKRGFLPDECCNGFNDPEYPKQWFFVSCMRITFAIVRHRLTFLTLQKSDIGLDTNIHGAWKQGYTGKGVVVTILDDGVEHTHDDLKDNYDHKASYDFNSNDGDPTPRLFADNRSDNGNWHGTRCAGQVAASANNSKCGVGAAFEASIGGIRMLDGRVTDDIECQSISYKRDYVDIYSSSWGPEDDGKTIDGPKACVRRALKEGVAKGRKGKGSIFVWASGNGGRHMDDCNLDGESCSCTLASVYSSGFTSDQHIVTTDVQNKCTDQHTGTSAAAPLAAGILALVLQANPELTWRDIQHIIVRGANNTSNDRDEKWTENGAGLKFHQKLGFGVLDATKMVNLAKNWTTVGAHRKCVALKLSNHTRIIPPQKILTIKSGVSEDSCKDSTTGRKGRKHLSKLEHVELTLTMSTESRGDIMLKLISPSQTTSKILRMRPEDTTSNRMAFKSQVFMSTNFWGEDPYGKWGLQIVNGVHDSNREHSQKTRIRRLRLTFWGTGDEEDTTETGKAPTSDESRDSSEDNETNESRELSLEEEDLSSSESAPSNIQSDQS